MSNLCTNPQAYADSATEIATATKRFLIPALSASSAPPDTFLTSPFLRGYVMGVIDAIAQHQGPAGDDDPLLVGVVFLRLYPGRHAQLAQTLRLAHDAGYCAGMASGGMAVYRSLTSNPQAGLDLVPILQAAVRLQGIAGEPEAKVAAMAVEIRARAANSDEFNLYFPAAFARHVGRPFDFDDADDLALAEATLWAAFDT